MTFQEYLKQKDPKRHPNVKVTAQDCYGIHFAPNPGHKVIVLKIHGSFYSYLLTPDSGLLWTMDEDGNKLTISVFSFVNKPANDSN
ncbi:MAG: hypothetical protein HQ522_11930 [Bacteroidetes bacterium]|nr:hypothetical protein [Bacteroidota bacterium]